MPLITTEKQFESDIAAALLSPAGGYTRNGDCYDPKLGLFVDTLIRFVQKTQPSEWAFFEKQNPVNPVRKFCTAFNNACLPLLLLISSNYIKRLQKFQRIFQIFRKIN